ncbi:hypothetical protein EAS62_39555 [Bradyrhizobium zhanjiangense]|uniref:Uncharacterized protein n=1 Tax=Bradyrhizobium zhanjiangense TaxID=1325107 RepID=A0ABY0D9G3_9BRAD|nr:hypothetical protein EAS62_39555 [Bradyrhizobium zhanjiangense]
MVGDFISERWAISNRNGGRFHFGIVGDFERNQQVRPITPAFCIARARRGFFELADMEKNEVGGQVQTSTNPVIATGKLVLEHACAHSMIMHW